MQGAVRDATAAGPLVPNELVMMGANPSVRCARSNVIRELAGVERYEAGSMDEGLHTS